MASVPLCKRSRAIHVLDNFPPTAAVVRAKANFSLLGCHWRTRTGDGRKIVIESILEPQPVDGHHSPTASIRICFLGPVIATASNTVETIVEQTPKLREAEAQGSFLLIEIAEYRQPDETSCKGRSSPTIRYFHDVAHELL